MKKFVKNFSLYMFPEIIINALPFITLPITTRYFGLEEFGLIALFNLCQVPFTVLCEYGVGYVIGSLWFDLKKDEQKQLLFTLLFIGAVMAIGSIIVMFPFYKWVFTLMASDSAPIIIVLFPWMALMVVMNRITPVFSNWIVLTEKAVLFSKIKLFEIFLTTIIYVGLIVYTQNVKFVIIGSSITCSIINAIKLFILTPYLTVSFKKYFYIETIKIGYPLTLRALFNLTRTKIDKFVISGLYTIQMFALYNWALRLYSMFATVEGHFSKVYSPKLLQALSKGNKDFSKFRQMFFAWFYVVFCGCICFYFIGESFITWLSNGVYTDAYRIILYLSCFILADAGLSGVFTGILYHKCTKYFLLSSIVSGCTCMGLSILLIPKFGLVGGVLSLGSVTIVTGIMGIIKRKLLNLPVFIEFISLPYICMFAVCILLSQIYTFKLDGILCCLTLVLSIHVSQVTRLLPKLKEKLVKKNILIGR
ncbi:MAG: oligosaccharide flippase family protein [bacterium]